MVLLKSLIVAIGLAFSLSCMQASSQGSDKQKKDSAARDKGKALVDAWLERTLAEEPAKDAPALQVPWEVEAIDLKAVRETFPKEQFYAVRVLKKLPRPDMLPKTLQTTRLVRVKSDESIERVESLQALKRLISKSVHVDNESKARNALLACLRLAEEFYRDVDMTFSVPEETVSVSHADDHLGASGKAIVTKGGEGEIRAILNFESTGSINPDDVKIDTPKRIRSDKPLR